VNGYELRKLRKRDSILEAASGLFARYGIKKTSLAEIARSAAVNPVTVYNHFGGKDGLVREVCKKLVDDEWERYRAIFDSGGLFFDKLLRIIAMKTVAARERDGSVLAAALAEDAGVRELVRAHFEEVVNPRLIAFLKEGQKSGDVRPDLSLQSIQLYIDMFTALAQSHPELLEDQRCRERATKEVWSLFLHGLAGRDSRDAGR
jgi:AcrR family transcriptional regulator